MRRLRLPSFVAVCVATLCLWAAPAQALTLEQARAMATGETDARIQALSRASADADERTAAFLQALANDAVKVSGEQVFVW
jgi:urea transport system permease protein